jgi:hypothetical protein
MNDKIKDRLPSIPSKLIRVALADLELNEKDPNYVIDMEVFHRKSLTEKCEVCLGGSALRSCGVPPDFQLLVGPERSEETWFTEKLWKKMQALNEARNGGIYTMFERLDIPFPKGMLDTCCIANYRYAPIAFKRDLHFLADYLESKGY